MGGDLCDCDVVYECVHFQQREGIMLDSFHAQLTRRGAFSWIVKHLQVLVFLDHHREVVVATHRSRAYPLKGISSDETWWKQPLDWKQVYGTYKEGRFTTRDSIWDGGERLFIRQDQRDACERQLRFYIETRAIMREIWYDESLRFKTLPKDVMRLILMAWVDPSLTYHQLYVALCTEIKELN